jgi:energy-coupling factor transporter ATP-binding protein EcfA2
MTMPLPPPVTTPETVFHIQGVTKVYSVADVEVHALRGVDLSLYPGEFIVVLGPSGSGKSTLLKSSPSGLAITVDGTNYTAPQTFQWGAGSSHTIAVASPLAGATGTQYVFGNWSDSGAEIARIVVESFWAAMNSFQVVF